MKHRKILIGLVAILLVIIIFLSGMLYLKSARYFYRDINELNENLELDGLKMLMDIDEAIELVGIEEKEEGFGGDFYFYKSKEYYFSVSTDSDFDQYRKIGQLSFQGENGRLFGYGKGSFLIDLVKELIDRGYELDENSGYGKNTYIKGCVIIDISDWEDKIYSIRIIIKERKYDGRVY